MSVVEHEVLTEVADGVLIRPMLTIEQAKDEWLGDLARRRYSAKTREDYGRYVDKFCETMPSHWDVAKIREQDCRRFLDRYINHADTTQGAVFSALNGFCNWLWKSGKTRRSPMERLDAPRRKRPEDRDVLTVSTSDVRKLLEAHTDDWTKKLSAWIVFGLGPRRKAASNLRIRDYDRERGLIRFKEKGDKVLWKPVPNELRALLETAIAAEVIDGDDPDAYLIPMRTSQRRPGDRDDRIVWNAIRSLADDVGVKAHTHALRRAFAVLYLEENPDDIETLRILMGHRSILTTQGYVKALNREQAMERVRGLALLGNKGGKSTLGAKPLTEKEGFEPSFEAKPDGNRLGPHSGGECIH